MQRLFSTFPGGSPGIGLLCLRFGTGIPLAQCAVTALSAAPLGGSVACNLLAAVAGIPLLAGLWTPIAATVLAIDELWLAISQPAAAWTHLPLALLGASLALLGPGAWSIDSRLFGRKRIDLRERNRGR